MNSFRLYMFLMLFIALKKFESMVIWLSYENNYFETGKRFSGKNWAYLYISIFLFHTYVVSMICLIFRVVGVYIFFIINYLKSVIFLVSYRNFYMVFFSYYFYKNIHRWSEFNWKFNHINIVLLTIPKKSIKDNVKLWSTLLS